MGIQEKILNYLLVYGKANKYKIATELKIDVAQVIIIFDLLQQEGSIKIKEGNAILVKGKKPIKTKIKKQKKPKVEAKEEQPSEEPEEEAKTEVPEEATEEKLEEVKKEPKEEVPEKPTEEKVEGTVKFFNPNKGFGFITGDDGKEYYVHESSLKEGVIIEADDRVSFKIVQGDKGPKAEEVEKISQSAEYIH